MKPGRSTLRDLKSLRQRRNRDESGRFLVEGKAVLDGLAAGCTPLALYATPAWLGSHPSALPADAAVVEVDPASMEAMSHCPAPPGLLAVFPLRRPAFEPGTPLAGLTLALDGIQDPGNLGTIIRTADWFGARRVLLGPGTTDPFHPKAVDASMGSWARVECPTADLPTVIAAADAAGTSVVGADLGGASTHTAPLPRGATLIVIGAEGRGLSDAVRARLRHFVTVPRFGGAESLNAAIAAALLCDAWRRANPA